MEVTGSNALVMLCAQSRPRECHKHTASRACGRTGGSAFCADRPGARRLTAPRQQDRYRNSRQRVQNGYISASTPGLQTSTAGTLGSANCRPFQPAQRPQPPSVPGPKPSS